MDEEEFLFHQVCNNEKTARIMLELMIERGVEISHPVEQLTHDEIKKILFGIRAAIKAKEQLH